MVFRMSSQQKDCPREGPAEGGESLTPVSETGVCSMEYGGSNLTFLPNEVTGGSSQTGNGRGTGTTRRHYIDMSDEEKKRSESVRSIDLTLGELDELTGCEPVAGRGLSTPRSEKVPLGTDNTTSSNVKRKRQETSMEEVSPNPNPHKRKRPRRFLLSAKQYQQCAR
ncbi:hypothetical protein ABEB36_014783 [Hypothenemus hampei]|uniref:Uncharacterized protein n=1 Tax=Hypothenemus hampei TaxID=57062 RepID=A0ABD1E5L0_HYPHA